MPSIALTTSGIEDADYRSASAREPIGLGDSKPESVKALPAPLSLCWSGSLPELYDEAGSVVEGERQVAATGWASAAWKTSRLERLLMAESGRPWAATIC